MYFNFTERIKLLKKKPGDFIELLSKVLKWQTLRGSHIIYIAERNGEKGVGLICRGRKLGEWFPSIGALPGDESDNPRIGTPANKRSNFFSACKSPYAAMQHLFENAMEDENRKEYYYTSMEEAEEENAELRKELAEIENKLKTEKMELGMLEFYKKRMFYWKGKCADLTHEYGDGIVEFEPPDPHAIDENGEWNIEYLGKHYPDSLKKSKPVEIKTKARQPKARKCHGKSPGIGSPADVRIEIEQLIGGTRKHNPGSAAARS
jgi:hypothetical protein